MLRTLVVRRRDDFFPLCWNFSGDPGCAYIWLKDQSGSPQISPESHPDLRVGSCSDRDRPLSPAPPDLGTQNDMERGHGLETRGWPSDAEKAWTLWLEASPI